MVSASAVETHVRDQAPQHFLEASVSISTSRVRETGSGGRKSMRNYMSRARSVFGGCVLAGLLSGPSCAAGGEDVGQLQQPLLCQSVAVCDDADPCTDDLCLANLCVNLPLVNCCQDCGGAGGGGAGGDAGSTPQGGKSGALGGSAGTNPLATDGGSGGERAGGGPDVGGMGNGGDGVIDSGGTSHAGQPVVSNGATAAAAGDANGQDGAADANAWRMQGGGCTLSAGTAGSAPATAWALLGMLILGCSRPRRRQQRGHGDPSS